MLLNEGDCEGTLVGDLDGIWLMLGCWLGVSLGTSEGIILNEGGSEG